MHQASKDIAAVVNDATIGVGEQTDARVVGRDGVGQFVEVTHGGRHVFGMECAGDLQRTNAASLGRVIGESGELGLRSRDDDLAGTVDVRGRQPHSVAGGDDGVGISAEDGAHARRRAGGGIGHSGSALAHKHHRLLGGEYSGAYGCGDLADGVAGAGADRGICGGWVREQAQQADEPGAYDQRLGDGSVFDGVGVGSGSVLDEIDAADHRQPFEALAHARDVEPRSEKAGTLGALTGRDDYQHALSLPWMATKNSRLADQSQPKCFGGFLQRLVHGGRSPQHQG